MIRRHDPRGGTITVRQNLVELAAHVETYLVKILNFSQCRINDKVQNDIYSLLYEGYNYHVTCTKIGAEKIALATFIDLPVEEEVNKVCSAWEIRYSILDTKGRRCHLRTVPLTRTISLSMSGYNYVYFHAKFECLVGKYWNIDNDTVSLEVDFFTTNPAFKTRYLKNPWFSLHPDVQKKGLDEDAVIITSDKVHIKVHESVIKQKSSILHASIFDNKDTELESHEGMKRARVGFTSAIMTSIVQFIYLGKVDLLDKQAEELGPIAGEWKIHDLENECLRSVLGKISIEKFCDIYALAHAKNWVNLKIQCDEYIKFNKSAISKSDAFKKFVETADSTLGSQLKQKLAGKNKRGSKSAK